MPTTNIRPGSGQQLQDIADALGKSRKVVVITGAGISTSCGIPVSSKFRIRNIYALDT
jgi:NAD-dependent SIR2 family protein deacetylase